ncbi:hypothetical protein Q3V23_00090 [Streptomyces sp. VNUA116]|uniref:hypothetical protein n=1 Tax=Streptomyces sp. VNUA116 TaxID=3062449 RepID=UPI00267578F9|nr:hypothetical protein [Streptomyces sp. VNUA116]WKU42600.1 hypothetical protein Q3V23_00090 [Streptomyces sp. VNUA116]
MALLEGELGSRAFADPVPEDVWLAFLRFGRRLFQVPDTPDADGLLFQYGTYAFDGPATFTLDLTRQFEVSDSDGDHDHYVQVHCELRYGLTPALEALGSFHSWFFHDAGADLEEWAQVLTERAAWTAIRKLKPTEIRVYQEQV